MLDRREERWVRTGARVGPNTWIEDQAMIDHDAVVAESWVGPRTYVGALTQVQHSLAWGTGLLNFATSSFIDVPDAFLLADLKPPPNCSGFEAALLGRFLALAFGVVTSPVALIAWWRSRRQGLDFCATRWAMAPLQAGTLSTVREVAYREFPTLGGFWRRWPQLWSIVRGDFAWIGNRPITREQAAELASEFEQLWLAAPVGLLSLADAEGCAEVFDDAARAHASFYAAQFGRKLDLEILRRLFKQKLLQFP